MDRSRRYLPALGLCLLPLAACGATVDVDGPEAITLTEPAASAIEPEYDYVADPADEERSAQSAGAPHRVKAVEKALTQMGVKESGCANCGVPLHRYTQWFWPGSDPQPWCAFFVSWAWDRTDDDNHRVEWGSAGPVEAIHAYARKKDALVKNPTRGDIFGYSDDSHTGYVTSVNERAGTFNTIEGNWDDRVARTTRSLRGSYWFARIH